MYGGPVAPHMRCRGVVRVMANVDAQWYGGMPTTTVNSRNIPLADEDCFACVSRPLERDVVLSIATQGREVDAEV